MNIMRFITNALLLIMGIFTFIGLSQIFYTPAVVPPACRSVESIYYSFIIVLVFLFLCFLTYIAFYLLPHTSREKKEYAPCIILCIVGPIGIICVTPTLLLYLNHAPAVVLHDKGFIIPATLLQSGYSISWNEISRFDYITTRNRKGGVRHRLEALTYDNRRIRFSEFLGCSPRELLDKIHSYRRLIRVSPWQQSTQIFMYADDFSYLHKH